MKKKIIIMFLVLFIMSLSLFSTNKEKAMVANLRAINIDKNFTFMAQELFVSKLMS